MRTLFLARRIILQQLKDKRTLGLLFFAPLMVLFLLYTVLGGHTIRPRILTLNLPAAMEKALKKEADVTLAGSRTGALEKLKTRGVDAVAVYHNAALTVSVEGSDTSVTAAVKKALASAMASYEKSYLKSTLKKEMQSRQARLQKSVKSQLAAKQAEMQREMKKQLSAAMQKMQSSLAAQAKKNQAAMKAAVQAQLQKLMQAQEAQMKSRLAQYQKTLRQKTAAALQSYGAALKQSLSAYLSKNGLTGEGLTLPAFALPRITPPDLSLGSAPKISLSLPQAAPQKISVPSLTLPSLSDSGLKLEMPDMAASVKLTEVSYRYLNGSDDMSLFYSVSPYMMGFFIFFFVFLISGISFLRERMGGTLERLLATPVRRYQIVLGYFLGFGVFVFAQTIVIQLFMTQVLGITSKNPNSFWLVMLVNLLLAAGSLALGTFLSAFAENELQMMEFIPIAVVPQIFFCGIFSLRGSPVWVRLLSDVFPLTYGAKALTDVIIRGLGFANIVPCLLALAVYPAVFLVLNTLALKKYRSL